MDKKLLDALNNLSIALVELSMTMQESKSDSNKSATSTALTSSKIEKKIELIDKGVKKLQEDNKKIIKNQEQLLKLAKSQKDSGPVGDASDPKKKSKIKDGLATIMMIAVGVLAIGLAFKLVGSVDFVSVIALAIALPLVAMAFEKIAKLKDLKPKDMFMVLATVVVLSLAIVASSLILGMVKPVGIFKLITAVLIGATFAALAYGLPKLAEGFSNLKVSGVWKMIAFGPAILLALSISIAVSSHVLGQIKPVGIFKLFTGILIAAMFGAVGYGLGKIVEGLSKSKLNPAQAAGIAILMPILLVALSYAIAISSRALSLVKPVGLFKLITAALIGLVFIPLSYSLQFLGKAMSKITIKEALMMPIVLVLLAGAIMLSSYLFNMTEKVPGAKLWNIVKQAGTLGAIGLIFGLVIPLVAKLPVGDLIKGSIVLIGLSVVIMVTSLILGLGNYENYPALSWIIGVAATMAAFAFGALTIGGMVFGPQALVVLAGLAAILVISATIVATSHILAAGNYEKYPSIIWTLATLGGSIVPFLAVAVVSGILFPFLALGSLSIILISYTIVETANIIASGKYDTYPGAEWIASVLVTITGFSALAILMGNPIFAIFGLIGMPMLIGIAYTIKEISNILSGGKYDMPGFTEWALGVSLLYMTFVPIMVFLGTIALVNAVISFFGPDPWKMAGEMMVGIASTVVLVSRVLGMGKYDSGPTKEWAESVSIALGAFMPVYRMMVASKVLESIGISGLGPDEFTKAILTVTSGIVFASIALDGFEKRTYPTKEWAEGVGISIGAFAPVYSMLLNSKILEKFGVSGVGPNEFVAAIRTVVSGIVEAANAFAGVSVAFRNGPPKKWAEGVGAAISGFMPALEYIAKQDSMSWLTKKKQGEENLKSGIRATVTAIIEAAKAFNSQDNPGVFKTQNVPSKKWGEGVGAAINAFMPALKFMAESDTWMDKLLRSKGKGETPGEKVKSMIGAVASGIKEASLRLAGGNYTTSIPENWVKGISGNIKEYVQLAEYISESSLGGFGSFFGFSAVDGVLGGMINLTKGYDALATAIKSINGELEKLDVEKLNALKNLNASIVLMSLMDPAQFKEMMDELEDKGGVLLEALELDKKEEGKKPKKGGSQPKIAEKKEGGGGTAQRTISDLYAIMESVDTKLGQITGSADKISKYVDEIRGETIPVRIVKGGVG